MTKLGENIYFQRVGIDNNFNFLSLAFKLLFVEERSTCLDDESVTWILDLSFDLFVRWFNGGNDSILILGEEEGFVDEGFVSKSNVRR